MSSTKRPHVHAHCIAIGSWVGTGSISITQVSLWPYLDAHRDMCHGQAARRQRREQPCVWHDGTEISSGFQTKPWLVAMTACSTRYRPPADFFGYEVVEASQSWMTVSQHQGARGSHAAPPTLVAALRALLTDNADESRKSEHVSRRAIAVATTPSAGPSASERVRERQVFPHFPLT